MRKSRFLLPFGMGALSMLLVVIAAGWAAPGLLGRVSEALRPALPSPAAAEVAVSPSAADSAAGVPSGGPPSPAGPAAQAPLPAPPSAVAPGPGGARLLIPVVGVKAADLIDTYEDARGQGRRHDAIDIMAPRGAAVVASADGVVMKLFQSARGGTTLYQMAADGRTIYYYAHLDGYAPGMAEGRALRRGEVLGYVGDTGDSGRGNYHLHFEVSTAVNPRQYWGGVPQNPYPLLQ